MGTVGWINVSINWIPIHSASGCKSEYYPNKIYHKCYFHCYSSFKLQRMYLFNSGYTPNIKLGTKLTLKLKYTYQSLSWMYYYRGRCSNSIFPATKKVFCCISLYFTSLTSPPSWSSQCGFLLTLWASEISSHLLPSSVNSCFYLYLYLTTTVYVSYRLRHD